MKTYDADLGFTFRRLKSGEVSILHNGQRATTLRGSKAADFVEDMAGSSPAEQQQEMARLTGNYKHGNERVAKNHPRNKR